MDTFSDEEDEDFMCFSSMDNEDLARKITDEGNLRPIENSKSPPFSPLNFENVPNVPQQNGAISSLPKPRAQVRRPVVNSVVADDLRMAAISGNLIKVQEMLGNGLDVDVVLKSNWTCLMYACSCGHHSIVKFLLEKKADPNYQKDMFTPLLAVCASRQDKAEDLLNCLKSLIEYGAKPSVWDRHHMTPLMYCARENRTSMLKELLTHNVEVDRQDHRGWTALFWAANSGHGESLRILLENGADPSKMATDGQTASDIAYAQKYDEIGDVLERIRSESIKELSENDKETLQKFRKRHKDIITPQMDRQEVRKSAMYGELEMFLSGLNLTEYIPLFHEHSITFFDFLLLTEEDLEKIGVIKVGVRKHILDGIKTVHSKKWEKSSLPNLRKQQYISCPDAVAMMANISNHLRYIKSTVRYLRNEVQKTPRILELGQEAANVHKLLEESTECIKNETILHDELRFFKLYLEKVQDYSEYQPADFLVESIPTEGQKVCKLSRVAIVSITVAVGLIVWKKPQYLARVFVFPQRWHWMLT